MWQGQGRVGGRGESSQGLARQKERTFQEKKMSVADTGAIN